MTATPVDIKEHENQSAIGPSRPGENSGRIAQTTKFERHPSHNRLL